MAQKRLTLLVSLCGRTDYDVQPVNHLDLIVIYLRENELLFNTKGIISPAVKRLSGNPPEIPDPRQCGANQPVEELVHDISPKRYLAAYRHPLPQFKRGDRFFGL